MGKVLAYASPASGHVHPIVPTLLELRRRGHDVAARVPSWEVERLCEAGIAAQPIDPGIEAIEHEDWKGKNPMDSNRISLEVFARRAERDFPDLQRAIDTERPDLLLIDVSSQGAATLAELRAEPWAMYSPYPLYLPSRDAPAFGAGFKPPRGALGRLRDRVVWRMMLRSFRESLARSNEQRRQLGLTPLSAPWDFLRIPPVLLSFTAEPFEYPHSDWPESVRLVGPGIWQPGSQPARWLEEVERPVVLVTLSTEFQSDRKLAEAALEALAGEDLYVVVTTAAVDPADLPLPDNARVERFLPHGPILERAACVVCHAGMGITQKALALGVPVCAVPFGRDQFEVARRVEVAQAGVMLPARKLTPDRLRKAVRAAVAKRDGARRVAEGFARVGGAAVAADAVEEQLRDGAPRHPAETGI